MADLEFEDFGNNIGTSFHVHIPGADQLVKLILATVTPATVGGMGTRKDAFSLIFVGPTQPALPQQIYPMHHEEMGSLEIFIVPIGLDQEAKCMRYEAIFS